MVVAWENNTLHFDQYSQLTIRLNFFQFSADIKFKRDLKFDKKKSISYSKARRDKSISVQHQRFKIKTDRIYFGKYSQRPFE